MLREVDCKKCKLRFDSARLFAGYASLCSLQLLRELLETICIISSQRRLRVAALEAEETTF